MEDDLYIPSWMHGELRAMRCGGSLVSLRLLDTLPEPVRTQAARLQAATGAPDETYVVYVGTELLGFWLPKTAP